MNKSKYKVAVVACKIMNNVTGKKLEIQSTYAAFKPSLLIHRVNSEVSIYLK